MNIAISKDLFEELSDWLTLEPFSLTAERYRFDEKLEIDLADYLLTDLRCLQSVLEKGTVRGAKTAVRDVKTWIKAITTTDGALPRARKLEHAVSLLKAYMQQCPHKHVYTMEEQHRENAILCYYLERVQYCPPNSYHNTPEHLDITLKYKLFGQIKQRTITLVHSDVLSKDAPSILAAANLLLESDELREAYLTHVAKYNELFDQVGLQLLAEGYCDDEDVDCADGRHKYRYGTQKYRIARDGQKSRVVVDIFQEDDKERSKSHAYVMNDFWNQDVVFRNGVAELVGEVEYTKFVADCPIHPYLVVFDLQKHMRCRIHVANVEPYVYNEDAIHSLTLPSEIVSLVNTLMAHRKSEFRDVIKNKSGGTIVLLEGGPGIGKTLTAEIYAEATQRPLFSVQCSQLGVDLDDIEKNLMLVLERGRRWDAVTLFDESDVYVCKRGTDLHQNAIVGIFLRVLEYQAGLLFLTTNRGEMVDDAVLSRCTARVHYDKPIPPFQTRIWKTLRDANKANMSDETIEQVVKNHNFSGRDIKNILKLGMAVAADRGTDVTYEVIEFATRFKPTCE